MQTHVYLLAIQSSRVVSTSASPGAAIVWTATVLALLLILFACLLAIRQIKRSACSPRQLARLVYETILSRSIYSERLPPVKIWQHTFSRCRDFECVFKLANEIIERNTDPHGYLEHDAPVDSRNDCAGDLVEGRLLSGKVGYLRIGGFAYGVSKYVERQLHQIGRVQSLIVDLRGNRGGIVLEGFKTASLFLRRGTLAHFEYRVPGDDSTRQLKYSVALNESGIVQTRTIEGSASTQPTPVDDQVLSDRLKLWRLGQFIVLLVDEGSASAAEMFAGALKDNRAAVIAGRPTYGKGVGQSHVTLSGDVALNVTSFKFFTPNGFWPGDGTKPGSGLVPTITILEAGTIEGRCDCSDRSTGVCCDEAIRKVLKVIDRF